MRRIFSTDDRALLGAATGSRRLLRSVPLASIRTAQQALAESGQSEIDETTRQCIREAESTAAIAGAEARQARAWAVEDYRDSLPVQAWCRGSAPMSYAPSFDASDRDLVSCYAGSTDPRVAPHVVLAQESRAAESMALVALLVPSVASLDVLRAQYAAQRKVDRHTGRVPKRGSSTRKRGKGKTAQAAQAAQAAPVVEYLARSSNALR